MTDPLNHADPPDDPRLAQLLREAGDWRLPDAEEPIARARRMLLERLEAAESATRLPRFLVRHRLALGGVAASLALAASLLVALISGTRLSAMERMANELKEITSYRYRSGGSNSGIDDDGRRETRKDDETYAWLAPDGFRQQTKIVKIVEDLDGGNRAEVTLVHIEEVFPPGKPGLFIDHQYKTFCRSLYEPLGSKMYPSDFLRLIRENSYDVLADLGTRQIGGADTHGYRLQLKNQRDDEGAVHDPVELWDDSRTDLPVEISYSGGSEGWKYEDLTNDFQWNIPLDPQEFEPRLPADYADITPPTDPQDFGQIADALRLFAELSGGHYPQAKKFNPRRIHDGMLRMVDSLTPAARQEKRAQVEKATAGLSWIARILRNRYQSGYRGALVGPTDKDQVLLWFADPVGNRYRVFYSDLRTEVVTDEQKSKLVPKAEIVGEPQSE